MRKTAFAMILIIFISFFSPVTAQAVQFDPDFDVQSKAAYMVSLDTNTVIYQKNADEPMYPASLTKIMTAIVALENVKDIKTETATAPAYIFDEFYGIDVSHAGIVTGETLSIENLLYAMMMQSANEAASIVADYVGDGSIPYFVELMNKKAKEIGANNTHFVNPHGLFDSDQKTTAHDMALITEYAIKNFPEFMEMAGTTSKDIGPSNKREHIYLNTRNYMMVNTDYYYKGLSGVKTGTLEEAGRCFISTAKRDGYEYLLVLMGAPYLDSSGNLISPNSVFTETAKFYDWAFNTFRIKTLVEKGTSAGEAKLKLAWKKDHLKLMSDSNFQTLIPTNIDSSHIRLEPVVPEGGINAPVKKYDKVGELRILLADDEIGRVALVSAEDVKANVLLYILNIFSIIFHSFIFKFLLIFVIVLAAMYIGLTVMRNKNKRKSKSKQIKRTKRM